MDKGTQRVVDAVSAQLEPGEQVRAVLKSSQTGPSPWPWSINGYIWFLYIRYYAVAVTDRRVLLVALSKLSRRPRALAAAYPRSAVRVKEWKEGALWSVLRLDRPSGGELKLNIPRVMRSDAAKVVAALDSGPAA
jgi:hypothetical protein